jgi:uncharacterized protein involved in exopolysaccharide biosynthesis
MATSFDYETHAQRNSFEASATLREAMNSLRLDSKWVLAAFAIPMALATVISFVPKPTYEADSSLLVRFGREYVYNPETIDGNAQPMAFDRDQSLHAEAEIVMSRDVIAKAIGEVGLMRMYPSIANQSGLTDDAKLARGIIEAEHHMKAELLPDSNVIHVSFAHTDPAISAQFVNDVVDAYLDRRRTIFAKSRSAFLDEQVEQSRAQVSLLERQMAAFKKEHGIVSYDQQLSLLLDEEHQMQIKLADATQEASGGDARVKQLNRTLHTVPANLQLYKEVAPTAVVDDAKRKLLDLQLKQRDLQSKFFDTNPLVKDVDQDIFDTQSFLRNQTAAPHVTTRDGRNPVRDTLESDLIRAQADDQSTQQRQSSLQKQLGAVHQRIDELAALEPQMNDMKREATLAADAYTAYAHKLQEARVMDALDQKTQTNVVIFQSAYRPTERKSYQMLIIGIGFALSLCCALVTAYGLAFYRQSRGIPGTSRPTALAGGADASAAG